MTIINDDGKLCTPDAISNKRKQCFFAAVEYVYSEKYNHSIFYV